jgi:hypothetical protein
VNIGDYDGTRLDGRNKEYIESFVENLLGNFHFLSRRWENNININLREYAVSLVYETNWLGIVSNEGLRY